MARKTVSKHEFAGLPINDLIGNPLVAIARAQSMMAKEQLRSLLDSCFTFIDGVYEPVLLRMTVTRTVIEPAIKPLDPPEIIQVTTYFYLPMITIFPINSLGIENAEIDFGVEITSQYRTDTDKNLKNTNQSHFYEKSGAGISGKISNMPAGNGQGDTDNPYSLRISVEASSMPLSKGLLEIINIYSTSIQTSNSDNNV